MILHLTLGNANTPSNKAQQIIANDLAFVWLGKHYYILPNLSMESLTSLNATDNTYTLVKLASGDKIIKDNLHMVVHLDERSQLAQYEQPKSLPQTATTAVVEPMPTLDYGLLAANNTATTNTSLLASVSHLPQQHITTTTDILQSLDITATHEPDYLTTELAKMELNIPGNLTHSHAEDFAGPLLNEQVLASAIRASLNLFLEQFDPKELEQLFQRCTKADMTTESKTDYWQAYHAYFAEFAHEKPALLQDTVNDIVNYYRRLNHE
jgi:predicted component of type VI protein secretion system